jgi:hypothetical protein
MHSVLKKRTVPYERMEDATHLNLSVVVRISMWNTRKVVWSHDLVQFYRQKDGAVVDAIPLSEVELVQEMNDDALSVQTESERKSETSKKKYHTFQIKTVFDGYNSGRSYYLRTKPDAESSRIVPHLRDSSEAARKRAVVLSRFKQAQKAVRLFHDSIFFQIAVCLLIVTVRRARIKPAQTGKPFCVHDVAPLSHVCFGGPRPRPALALVTFPRAPELRHQRCAGAVHGHDQAGALLGDARHRTGVGFRSVAITVLSVLAFNASRTTALSCSRRAARLPFFRARIEQRAGST